MDERRSSHALAATGLGLAVLGFGLVIFKVVNHQHRYNAVYGLVTGGETWYTTMLILGLFLGALGCILVGRSLKP